MITRCLVALAALNALNGCAINEQAGKLSFLRDDRTIEGAEIDVTDEKRKLGHLVTGGPRRNEQLLRVDLVKELDPSTQGCQDLDADACKSLTPSARFGNALVAFYEEYGESRYGRLRRNQLQHRIILASNVACDEYKRHLLSTQAQTNFLLGSLTTATAGLGAVFTDPATVRGLSGAAAILSGVRAEYNDAFFRRLVAEAITKGINIERDAVYDEIDKYQSRSLARYTVEAALADAIQYNARCTLIAGLENLEKSQEFFRDPGLKRLLELYDSKTAERLGFRVPSAQEEGAATAPSTSQNDENAGGNGDDDSGEPDDDSGDNDSEETKHGLNQ